MANVATLSARAAFDVSDFTAGCSRMKSGLETSKNALKDYGSKLTDFATQIRSQTTSATEKLQEKVTMLRHAFTMGKVDADTFARGMKHLETQLRSTTAVTAEIVPKQQSLFANFASNIPLVQKFSNGFGMLASTAGVSTTALAGIGVAVAGAAVAFKAAQMAVNAFSYAIEKLVGGLSFGANLAIEFERTQSYLQTITGSAEQAKKIMEGIGGFTIKGVRENVVLLAGMQIAGEKLIPTMQTLAQVASGNKDRLAELTKVYGEVMEAGVFTEKNFKTLLKAGVNVKDGLAGELGVSMEVMKQKLDAGVISSDDFHNSLVRLSETTYAKALTDDADLIGGKLDIIADKADTFWRKMSTEIGSRLPLTDALDAFSGVIDQLIKYTPVIVEVGKRLLQSVVTPLNSAIDRMKMLTNPVQTGWNVGMNIKQGKGVLDDIVPGGKTALVSELGEAINAAGAWARGLEGGKPIEGMQRKEKTPEQIMKEIEQRGVILAGAKATVQSALQSGIAGLQGLLSGGIGAVRRGEMFESLKLGQGEKKEQVPEWKAPGALAVGSSEAFSAIIRNMVRPDKENIEQKQLTVMQKTATHIEKFSEWVLQNGMVGLARIDNLAEGV